MSLFHRKRLNMSNCCKECNKRKVGCHANCIDYKKWRVDFDNKKKLIKSQERKKYDYFYGK